MPTWLISSGMKTRESHRAWRIEGHCELERRQTSVVPRCYHWPCSCGTTSRGRCMDMAAIIQMVRPTRANMYSEYVTLQIVSFLESQVTNDTQRMDAVWDSYPPEDNLKAHAQQRRWNGERTRAGDGSTPPIPKSEWNSGFLKNEDNINELFSFISRQICKSDVNGTLLLSTYFDGVLTNRNFDVSGQCNQAEADTRVLLHLDNAAVQGSSKVCIRWTATLLSWRSGSIRAVGGLWYRKEVSRHSSSLTHFTQVFVRQSPAR